MRGVLKAAGYVIVWILLTGALACLMIWFRYDRPPPVMKPPTIDEQPGWVLITGTNSIAIGVNAVARFDNSIVLGRDAIAHETNELVIRYVDGSVFRMILKTNVDFGFK